MLVKKSYGSVKLIAIDRNAFIQELSLLSQKMREENPEVQEVWFFGSIARGDQRGTSDADILVLVSESTVPFWPHRGSKYRRYFTVPIPIDLFVYTIQEVEALLEQKNPFLIQAFREGIRL